MKFVVVGGGTAGWMTAATLVKAYPESSIVVYEDIDTPSVGVGESTTQFFRIWLNFLGLKDEEWMNDCDATYKSSVMFHDFHEVGDKPWQYPFGRPRQDSYRLDHWFYKQYKEGINGSRLAEDYCVSAQCAVRNKLPVGDYASKHPLHYELDVNAGFHFNASKFANWLRDNYCKPRGVKHIKRTLKRKPKADIIFDCTGFKSLFNDSEWIDYDYLPNNSAWVTRVHYDDKNEQITPYTKCTALSSGWVWNVPTWNTIGTGYVFCDKFISPEDARNEFRDHLTNKVQNDCAVYGDTMFRLIKFKTGRKKEIWKDNVVSIGLSAGFIEPLESNGLLSIHDFILSFVRVYSSNTQFMRDTFNSHCAHRFDAFASFVGMHYALSKRDDSPYWKHIQNIKYPRVHAFEDAQNMITEHPANFGGSISWDRSDIEALYFVMAGHQVNPFTETVGEEINLYNRGEPPIVMDDLTWDDDEFDKMPTQYEYLKEKIYEG